MEFIFIREKYVAQVLTFSSTTHLQGIVLYNKVNHDFFDTLIGCFFRIIVSKRIVDLNAIVRSFVKKRCFED